MDRQKTEGFGPVDLFELSGKLLPTLPWFPRTEKLAEQVADLIVGNRFLVKYDKTTELNNLLRFASFDYRRYMLYLGAAFAIARAGHPDWIYETFIECFRKDVFCEMDDRSEDDLGYRDYVASLAHE